jgi:hypothetical protein
MFVIVGHLLVSLSRQVGVGMVMRSRRRIVGVRRIDFSMCAIMLMLVGVQMLVRMSVRMAVRHVAMGVQVVMNVLMRMNMFMRVRLNRLIDLGHRVPPFGGVIANHGAHDGSGRPVLAGGRSSSCGPANLSPREVRVNAPDMSLVPGGVVHPRLWPSQVVGGQSRA